MSFAPSAKDTDRGDAASPTPGQVPSQKFEIKDLPTTSVTLYPARAHIVRDINDVVLRPGANEIIIHGITPTADEHSVQIDGKGAAIITDITVELVPNTEIFEEVYPELDEPEVQSDNEIPEEMEDPSDVQALTREIKDLEVVLKENNEIINSATRALETLDTYTRTLRAEKSSADDLAKTLEVYAQERQKVFRRHLDASAKVETIREKMQAKKRERERAWVPESKKRQKEALVKAKELEKKDRQQVEQRKERLRVREEKLKFWPKKIYRVVVSLEAAISLDTPASSRRGSMDSLTLAHGSAPDLKDDASADGNVGRDTTVSLSLSYVTKEASWSPRYDLNISSVNKVATLAYRAEFLNGTSETWKNSQLILSTSQTSYQGLEDKVPFMNAWHVKLGRFNDQGLLSVEEMRKPTYGNSVAPLTNRNELFGSTQSTLLFGNKMQQHLQKTSALAPQYARKLGGPIGRGLGGPAFESVSNDSNNNTSGALFGSSNNAGSSLFGSTANTAGAFGSAQLAVAGDRRRSALKSGMPAAATDSRAAQAECEESDNDMGFGLFDDDPLPGARAPGIGFEEAEWDDNGLTSTYEVPNQRTLAPSSLTRRHKIATLHATNIQMSHISVPKLRASAFLRAKIRNPSNTVTLLKGVAGLTLDGAFLGNTILNRVSPGQLFDLSLGVDPAVHISYPKPSVHRSTQGIFNKESDQIYTRSVWITNTKPVAIEMLVLDQVPISEDERLRIDILQPRGLSKEGDIVRAGSAAKQGASGTTTSARSGDAWGKATAKLQKDGELAWTVNLEKKQACLLKLEYEAKLPATEKIVSA